MKRIKTAVVGCGSISDIYMTNLTNGKFTVMELVACSDLMVERMNASAAKFGIKAMSLDEICADPEIEMVICLTTPAAHYPIIKQALLAGKHVFSEKMIAVDLWQGKELVQIANEKGLHLGVAPDTFLGASVQTAKYIVDKGLIGKPLSCRASISRDYGIYAEFLTHLAKKGAGIGFDMGGYYLTALAATSARSGPSPRSRRRMTPTASTPASARRALARHTMCRCQTSSRRRCSTQTAFWARCT